jgi:predicted nuclease with TOPRIM domain
MVFSMDNKIKAQKGHLDEIRRERAELIEQIQASQKTIERSQDLLKRIDRILAKATGQKS